MTEVYNVQRNKSMTPKIPVKQSVAKERARGENRAIKNMVDLF